MRKVTIALLVLVTLGLIAWDIFVYARGPDTNTISVVIHEYDARFPMIRFAFGVLCGHWFWGLRSES